MKHWVKLVNCIICISFVLIIENSRADSAIFCATLKNMGMSPGPVGVSESEYNAFVCAGEDEMDKGKFKKAVLLFEKAMAIPIHEAPSFELFPTLALAYFRAGERKQAELALLKARLTISVYTGVLLCMEKNNVSYLRWARRENDPYPDDVGHEVEKIMCGAIIEGYYVPSSLEDIVQKGELVKHYFEIKQIIRGQK